MPDFSSAIDLPLIWGGIIGFAVFLYVLLDGFDLGCGILFPFAPSDKCRDRMMNSIAPFWDGNETWLVLGGGGLFAAFPLAYSVLMPALYLPVIFMLLGLIFRGVAFEFRFKAHENWRHIWDHCFHFGSLLAAFSQGVILGGFVQGVAVKEQAFDGQPLDWLTPFALMCGVALVFGYALLGATWLNMKTEDQTQEWARKCARYVVIYVLLFMGLVSLWMPLTDETIRARWFSTPNIYFLAPIPLAVLAIWVWLLKALTDGRHRRPFFLSIGLFILGYAGLAISVYPNIVPPALTIWDAASRPESQSLMLIGTLPIIPIILCYTAYSYYIFRGKSSHESLY